MKTAHYVLAGPLAECPKISLHDHLDGGLRPETIHALAQESSISLPVDGPAALAQWFQKQANSGSLEEYLRCFTVVLPLLQTREALQRVAAEAVEDLARDGVIYAELRWAPSQHTAGGLSLDAAVEAVQAGLEEGMARAEGKILATQLLTAMRQEPDCQQIAELTVRQLHRGHNQYGESGYGVVGFDLAGPEAGNPPEKFAANFDYLARNLVPVTVHAGEAAGQESIAEALTIGRALRIGHGVGLVADLSSNADGDVVLGRLAQWVLDRNITLEICPSSNEQTGATARARAASPAGEHPLPLLYAANINTTINCDNRLLSVRDLSTELARSAEKYRLSFDDLLAMQINAAEAAFLDFDTRANLVDELINGWQL